MVRFSREEEEGITGTGWNVETRLLRNVGARTLDAASGRCGRYAREQISIVASRIRIVKQ